MTAPRLSRDVARISGSGIRAVADAARRVPGAIRLEMGEPDFPTPPHIVEAAHAAARGGATGYGPTPGLPELREAIAEKLRRVNGIDASAERVVVTAGGVQGLFSAYRALLDPGDEILVPDPGWPNFTNLAHVVGARPVGYALSAASGYLPSVETLDASVTARTRAVLVNSPANPLGVTWPPELSAAVAEWAGGRGLWLVSDECYDRLWFDEPPSSPAALVPEAPVVGVFSFSKTYAMTGWRVGYVVAHEPVARHIARVQETAASCTATPTQHAALAALTGDQDVVERMRVVYRRRRERALRIAEELGLSALRPSGAFYLWLDVSGAGRPSADLALALLRDAKVAVAPGTAFGPNGEGRVRVSLAADPDSIEEGLRRLAAFIAR